MFLTYKGRGRKCKILQNTFLCFKCIISLEAISLVKSPAVGGI